MQAMSCDVMALFTGSDVMALQARGADEFDKLWKKQTKQNISR
jgi:hypothetical protein